MRRMLTGLCLMALFMAAGVSSASAAPMVLNHHGRLLDAADVPVADGTYTIIYSLFATPDGGAPLWSETREAATKGGLFSCDLGRLVPLDPSLANNDSLYLQVQVAGEAPLLPRLRVGSTMRAGVSGGVQGDITTTPGSLSMTDPLGMRTVHHWASDASAGFAIDEPGVHLTQMVTPDSLVYNQGTESFGSRVMIHKIHNGSELRSLQAVYPDSTVFDQGGDFGTANVIHRDLAARNLLLTERTFSTGFDSASVSEACDAIGARLAIKTKGTSAKREIRASTDADASSLALGADLDGDGVMDNSVTDSVDAAGVRRRVSSGNLGSSGQDGVELALLASPDSIVETSYVRKNGAFTAADFDRKSSSVNSHRASFFDVFTEATLDQDCDATGARLAIKTKGTSAKRLIAGGDCDDTDAMLYTNCDDDGDGSPESIASQSSSSAGVDLSMSTRIDGTPARISTNFTVAKQTQSASFGERCDLNGDGVAESQFEQRCTPDSVVQIAEIGDGSSSSSYNMRTRINDLETKLITIGLLGTGRAMQVCDETSANVSCDLDIDNNSTVDRSAWQKVDNSEASCGVSTDNSHDGTPDVTASATASESRSELKGHFQTGDVPTQSDFTTTADATGGHQVLSSMSGSTTGTIRMAATPDSTVFDLGYHGSTTGTIRLQASATGSGNPIEHSSGAHLTVGGVWTNASDVNLKENFKSIDGQQLLGKIDELPISRWNYKNESDEVTHIGPTAQDFVKIFAVGDNDKSISTIDPAGIALAAIKELHAETRTLKEKVADLQKQVDDLAAKAAETDDLRAQIKQLSSMVEIIMGAKNADETSTRLASSKQN